MDGTPWALGGARPIKTDAVGLGGLLNLLAPYVGGDRRCWRVVRVPSVRDEDARQLHRTWETLQQDRTRLVNRLKAVSPPQPPSQQLQPALSRRSASGSPVAQAIGDIQPMATYTDRTEATTPE